jgi:hypothetical protein
MMPAITIEAIEEKQSELGNLIQQFKRQSLGANIKINGRTIELQPGERYAGAKLDAQGNHLHDVIVMAARPSGKLNFRATQEWAESVGGDASSPEEFALIKANCADLLTEPWYWTNKPHTDASYAWDFDSNGDTRIHYKSAAGGALAVRRF